MPSYKLTYVDIKWLGEGIRLILSYMGADWEDVRIMSTLRPESPWHKMKSETKFGKLPYLDVDGKRLYQSWAICRYLASEAGLLGSNAWENAEIDAICGTMSDLVKVVLAQQSSKPDFLFTELSWIDFYVIGAFGSLGFFVDVNAFEKYPNLIALKEKIHAIPKVKEWIDRRPDGL